MIAGTLVPGLENLNRTKRQSQTESHAGEANEAASRPLHDESARNAVEAGHGGSRDVRIPGVRAQTLIEAGSLRLCLILRGA
jgi:hypothetical protein